GAAEPPAVPGPPDPRSGPNDPSPGQARSTGADHQSTRPAPGAPLSQPESARGRVSRADVCRESGLSDRQLRELEQYGLLSGGAGGTYFDADVLPIAVLVADLSRFGLQARHLRAFKAAADREVGLLEQVAAPMARQRDPEARARSAEDVRQLVSLSLRLHVALVKAGLRSSAYSRGQDSAQP
ncbi:MAG: MerR family transcriptional regulator, partial [Frankiaceae bacterium]